MPWPVNVVCRSGAGPRVTEALLSSVDLLNTPIWRSAIVVGQGDVRPRSIRCRRRRHRSGGDAVDIGEGQIRGGRARCAGRRWMCERLGPGVSRALAATIRISARLMRQAVFGAGAVAAGRAGATPAPLAVDRRALAAAGLRAAPAPARRPCPARPAWAAPVGARHPVEDDAHRVAVSPQRLPRAPAPARCRAGPDRRGGQPPGRRPHQALKGCSALPPSSPAGWPPAPGPAVSRVQRPDPPDRQPASNSGSKPTKSAAIPAALPAFRAFRLSSDLPCTKHPV